MPVPRYIIQQPAPTSPTVVVQQQPGLTFVEQLLIACVAGGVLTTISVKFIDLVKSWVDNRNVGQKIYSVFLKVGEIYDQIERLKADLDAARVMVVRTHNGGDIPKVTTPLFASVLYEVYDGDYEPIKEFWNNREVNHEFIEVLKKIYNFAYLLLDFADIPPTSHIHGAFAHKEDSCCIATSLLADEKSFIYLVVIFRDCPETEEVQVRVDRVADHKAVLIKLLKG